MRSTGPGRAEPECLPVPGPGHPAPAHPGYPAPRQAQAAGAGLLPTGLQDDSLSVDRVAGGAAALPGGDWAGATRPALLPPRPLPAPAGREHQAGRARCGQQSLPGQNPIA